MPERERADSLSLEGERHDPDALYRMLRGGFSSGSRQRYAGLSQQVLERITEIYALPKPKGYPTSSGAIGGGNKARGGGHDADALTLGMRLRVWLDEEIPKDYRVSRDELLGLARRASARAMRLCRTRRGHAAPSIESRARVLELVQIYLVWLGRSCDHKGAKQKGRVLECPDCGMVRIDV